jgi:hypothetical protein
LMRDPLSLRSGKLGDLLEEGAIRVAPEVLGRLLQAIHGSGARKGAPVTRP